MNFGSKVDDVSKKQLPTYHIAPNFTTRPFPDGPLELGTLVEDLKQYYPINQGTSRITIPEALRYTDSKEDVNVSLKSSLSSEASILARVLDHSVGGDASLKGKKTDQDIFNIRKLETVYFYPQPSYIKQCLQLSEVKDYNEMANYKEPLYLITGLKIAWGGSVSIERNRGFDGEAGAGILAADGPVDIEVAAKAGVSSESGMVSSFGKPADFVLAIQVQKIYHKRAFLVGEPTLTTKRVVKNAVLVDDDEPDVEVVDNEVDFSLADLHDDDLQGLITLIGHDSTGQKEIWLLPADV